MKDSSDAFSPKLASAMEFPWTSRLHSTLNDGFVAHREFVGSAGVDADEPESVSRLLIYFQP